MFLEYEDVLKRPEHRLVLGLSLEAIADENPGFVSIVAMAETVWVLERAHELKTLEIVGAVERILQTDLLVVENEQEVFTALIALKKGQGSGRSAEGATAAAVQAFRAVRPAPSGSHSRHVDQIASFVMPTMMESRP